MQQNRLDQAAKAYEEALGTEANQAAPDVEKVSAMTGALADVYRAQGKLEAAAKLYKQVMRVLPSSAQVSVEAAGAVNTGGSAVAPLRERVMESLQLTEADINRHIQTLNAAEQSWTLLNRVAKPDLKGLAFVRALQAQTCTALGRKVESEQYLGQLMQLLRSRRNEVRADDPRSVMKALAKLVEGQEYEEKGEKEQAQQAYQQALEIAERDAKSDAALVWAIQQKTAKPTRRS
jgi:tetratricopeptide (TPR) repeat protein